MEEVDTAAEGQLHPEIAADWFSAVVEQLLEHTVYGIAAAAQCNVVLLGTTLCCCCALLWSFVVVLPYHDCC